MIDKVVIIIYIRCAVFLLQNKASTASMTPVLVAVYREFRIGRYQGIVHTKSSTARDKADLSTCVKMNKKLFDTQLPY
jgi:hypothetical protein